MFVVWFRVVQFGQERPEPRYVLRALSFPPAMTNDKGVYFESSYRVRGWTLRNPSPESVLPRQLSNAVHGSTRQLCP